MSQADQQSMTAVARRQALLFAGGRGGGTPGRDGADGLTPRIGENGHWWIGDEDTGIPAQGPQGERGPAGDATPEDEYETVTSTDQMTNSATKYIMNGTVWEYRERQETVRHNAYSPDTAIFNKRRPGDAGTYNGLVCCADVDIAACASTDPFLIKISGVTLVKGNYATIYGAVQVLPASGSSLRDFNMNVGGNTTLSNGVYTLNVRSDSGAANALNSGNAKYIRVWISVSMDAVSAVDVPDLVVEFVPLSGTKTVGEWIDTGIPANANPEYTAAFERIDTDLAAHDTRINRNTVRIASLEAAVSPDAVDDSYTVPDAFASSVAACIETVNERQAGADTTAFAFFTDTHANERITPALIAHIMKQCRLNFCFCGGDFITNDTSITEEAMLAGWTTFQEAVSVIPAEHFHIALGNHDGSCNGTLYTATEKTETFLRGFYEAQIKAGRAITVGGDGTYYFVDDKLARVRYIVLNSSANAYGTEQISWVKYGALRFTEPGWTVIFITHKPMTMTGAYLSDSAAMNAAITEHVNGTDPCKPTVAMSLSGHLHEDRDDTASLPWPSVATNASLTALSEDWNGSTAPADQIAFDIVVCNTRTKSITMTRIGFGGDRVFAY